ncbi:MAG: hypothetical protein OEY36_00770 [Gammaproteobacteria bacterium]|nr:hypothetical protein [Gammaproteobacteria bacterium]
MYKLLIMCLLLIGQNVMANEVQIVNVKMHNNDGDEYRVDVTLLHGDTGWDHYADGWEILDKNKKVIAQRILGHPHVNEQPFTRSLYRAKISQHEKLIYIRAHDKVHGYSELYKINLNKQ